MKILRISLRNIASLSGTHTVDFTRDPLRQAGLFSISGPTGSGKSTLLDALCLALYAQTPRLNSVQGTVKLSEGEGSMTQRDPANLLRRGTGEGFAEVAFVGVDQGVYTARWIIRRARNRADGAFQNAEMALLRGDIPFGREGAIVEGGKKVEVQKAIVAKLGLSFEQFTRAVLLAQNEFATFLKADDRERAEILQALTGTQRFESISRAVFARCEIAVRTVKAAESRLTGSAPLSVEARAIAEACNREAEAECRTVLEKVAARQSHAEWFEESTKQTNAARQAEETLRRAQEVFAGAASRRIELEVAAEIAREARPLRDAERVAWRELEAAAKALQIAEQAQTRGEQILVGEQKAEAAAQKQLQEATIASEQAQPELRRARELDARLPSLSKRLEEAVQQLTEAQILVEQRSRSLQSLRAQRAEAELELTALAGKRAALASTEPFFREAKLWLERWDRAGAARSAAAEAAKEFSRWQSAEQTKRSLVSGTQSRVDSLRAAEKVATHDLEKAEQAARAHDGEKVATDRRLAAEAVGWFKELLNWNQEFNELVTQRGLRTADLAQLKVEQTSELGKLSELRDGRIAQAESELGSARRAFELAEAAVADSALGLREKLVPLQPCPVCGASDHPYHQAPPSSDGAALRALNEWAVGREQALNELRNRLAALEANCGARALRIREKLATLDELSARLETTEARIQSHPGVGPILLLSIPDRIPHLLNQIAIEDGKLQKAEEADRLRREAEKAREDRRRTRDQALGALADLEKSLNKLEMDLAAATSSCHAAQSARAKADAVAAAGQIDVNVMLNAFGGATDSWAVNAELIRARFERETSQLAQWERRAGELAQSVERSMAAVGPVDEALRQAEADLKFKKGNEIEIRAEHDRLKSQRHGIFGGRVVDEVELELSVQLKSAVRTRDGLAEQRMEAEKRLITSAEALRAAGIALAEKTQRHGAARTALQLWLAGFAERTQRNLDLLELESMLARDQAWFRSERAALEALEHQVRTAEGARGVHQQLLAAHQARRPTTDEPSVVLLDLASLRSGLAQNQSKYDQARAALLADDLRQAENSQAAAEVEAARKAGRRWESLNELIGSADGAKFRNIAQRRTLDVLLGYTNSQLEHLARRYRLERIPESLNLLVVDREMADERRSVHSLSGGESFLVALGLALGLASLTSNRLRIESLFIDEGFGSLDPETLNTAMGALMQLEAQGRKVGIISHVSEMAEAIPVQIRVAKGRSGTSRLIVPGAPPEAAIREEAAPSVPSPLAHQILRILERELAAGNSKVSLRSLREEIGCAQAELNFARESLLPRVQQEGRSLILNPLPPTH